MLPTGPSPEECAEITRVERAEETKLIKEEPPKKPKKNRRENDNLEEEQ